MFAIEAAIKDASRLYQSLVKHPALFFNNGQEFLKTVHNLFHVRRGSCYFGFFVGKHVFI